MGFARHRASSALLGASRLPIEPYFCPPSVQRLSGSTSSSGSISWISPFLPSPDATTLSWTVPTALLLFPPSPVLQASSSLPSCFCWLILYKCFHLFFYFHFFPFCAILSLQAPARAKYERSSFL